MPVPCSDSYPVTASAGSQRGNNGNSKKDLVNCKNGAYLASSVIRTDGIIMGELLPL